MSTHIPTIIDAFKRVTATDSKSDTEWVVPYTPAESSTNQFVFFLKPEATEGTNLEYVLKLSLNVLESAGVKIGAIRVIGGPYLDRHNIMVEHYGVISKISKEGVGIISEAAKAKLESDFGEDIKAVGQPVGGHQFLTQNPDISPLALTTINDNVGTTRLAGGTYLCKFKMLGKTQLVLNPFHAFQLVPFIKKGNALILFECTSKTAWEDLRGKVCGATNPAQAEKGSIRSELLINKASTGMVAVNTGSNGAHMSAGPLEGLVELKRFLSDNDTGKVVEYSSLSFGAHLTSLGLGDKLEHFASNPNATVDGKVESLFDLTEEKSFDVSGEILKSVSK
jgi:hypothetical protein